ncbi:hypothetical protein, partial [Prevotella sp.]|uniref:hypothetical protein n=1 Tax=Prevotella sp. TaxID=59823 RepID=UPI003FD75E62
FYALSLDKVINGTLGVRSSTYNGYQWYEIMSVMSDVFLCGGDLRNIVNLSRFVSFIHTSLMRMHMTFLYVSHQMKLRFWLL